MDTSPGRVCVRVAGSEQANPKNAKGWGKFNGQRGTLEPCGQGHTNGFTLREVTCYNCRKIGHFSCDCPQQSWNQKGNHPREMNPFRSGWRGNGHGMGYNPCNNPGRGSNARISEVEQEEGDADTPQVAWAVADNRTSQQHADDWLNGVVKEGDEVKDLVLHGIWRKEDVELDFPNT